MRLLFRLTKFLYHKNMKQNTFGNDFSLVTSLRFFHKWRKVLLLVTIIAFVLSLVTSLLITPRYKSSVVFFPTSSNRMSKAIITDRYDFMDYGSERDCEYAIQILSSQAMMNDVCTHFNLMEHYDINANATDKNFQLEEKYKGYVTVQRTEYLGVEVSVMDEDPQYAADIANFMAENYDSLCTRIHKARATDACLVLEGVCNKLENEARHPAGPSPAAGRQATDIHDVLSYKFSFVCGIPQAVLYQELAKQTSAGNSAAANRIRSEIASHKSIKGSYAGINDMLQTKREELAEIQAKLAQRQTDLENNISYKYWLDKAVPADKKAYPKRLIIVALSTIASLIMCILVLLVMERSKQWNITADNKQE